MGQSTSAAADTMRADAKALVDTNAELAPLLGTWVNAKRNTDHVARVVVTERAGELRVRLYGSPVDEPVDWGEVDAIPCTFTGTTSIAGFHAHYTLGTTRIEIAGNVKLGILVIQTYTTFADGSGRLSQFSREFFYRSEVDPGAGEVRTGLPFLAGDWVNTNPNTRWITGFTFAVDQNAGRIRVRSARDPVDWGETEVSAYLDEAGGPAFHAEYDLGSVSAALAGNTGKDIIIIAAYLRFPGDESANDFCREFFVPRG